MDRTCIVYSSVIREEYNILVKKKKSLHVIKVVVSSPLKILTIIIV